MGVMDRAAAQALVAAGFAVQGWSRTAKQLDNIATFSGDEGLATLELNALGLRVAPRPRRRRGMAEG